MDSSLAAASPEPLPDTAASSRQSLRTHNVTDRQGAVTAAGDISASTIRSQRKPIAFCHLIVATLALGLLIWASLGFRGTWARQCDYNLKIWVLVTLARLLAQMVVLLTVSHCCREGRPKFFVSFIYMLLNVSDLFSLCWFFYGIKPVLVDTTCDIFSYRWGISLWSIQCILLALPCCMLCVCLPIAICLVGPPISQESAQHPTPPEIVSKLEVKKYREVKHLLGPNLAVVVPVEPQTTEVAGLSQAAAGIRSLTGIPLPDPSRQFRRIQSSRMGSLSGTPSVPDAVPLTAAVGGHLPDAETLGRQRSQSKGPACPICFCEFDDDEDLLIMPCDERHAFHTDCVTSWLAKSRLCPMCRGDVVEILTQNSNGGKNGSKDDGGNSKTKG